MIVREITAENDWTFGKGRNNYLSANRAVMQNIKTRLQSFLGDCFFDTTAGIDWFNLLGGKSRNAIELAVRSTILNTVGVTGIVAVSINVNNARLISLEYTVNTIYSAGNNETFSDDLEFAAA